jgi:hypothetical protein
LECGRSFLAGNKEWEAERLSLPFSSKGGKLIFFFFNYFFWDFAFPPFPLFFFASSQFSLGRLVGGRLCGLWGVSERLCFGFREREREERSTPGFDSFCFFFRLKDTRRSRSSALGIARLPARGHCLLPRCQCRTTQGPRRSSPFQLIPVWTRWRLRAVAHQTTQTPRGP